MYTHEEIQSLVSQLEGLSSSRPMFYMKFCKERKYAEDVLSGKLYANTPEYFRQQELKTGIRGQGDKNELTPEELKSTHICPHCRYQLGDHVKNVYGQLDNIETRIDDLLAEWTKTLLDTISDPIVASQKEYLTADQKKAIDDFESSRELPKRVDDFFVKAITALLQGFEPVVIDTEDLLQKLEELPPLDEAAFAAKIKDILGTYTKGKDTSKLRIVVTRKEEV